MPITEPTVFETGALSLSATPPVFCGAGGGTRTHTALRPLPPEDSASTNSATPAWCMCALGLRPSTTYGLPVSLSFHLSRAVSSNWRSTCLFQRPPTPPYRLQGVGRATSPVWRGLFHRLGKVLRRPCVLSFIGRASRAAFQVGPHRVHAGSYPGCSNRHR